MPKVSTCFHVTSTPFFMLAVPYQHASNPFLGADQGGIEWGGGVSVRDSQFSISGKGPATSPSTKLVLKYIELR